MKIPAQGINKIAIILPNKPFFGAMLIQIPMFQHLRENFPGCYIKAWSPTDVAGLFLEEGFVDELIVYSRKSPRFKLLSEVNNFKADLLINMRPKSEILNLFSGISNAKLKVGFSSLAFLDRLFTYTVPFSTEIYRALNYMNLLSGIPLEKEFLFKKINGLEEKATISIDEKKVVCLIPGGGEGEHKRWGIENFCALATSLLEKDPAIVFYFIMGNKEQEYVPQIEKSLPKENYQLLFNTGMYNTVKVVEHAQLTVANDCGPSHLAQMCEKPYIGVWGWTEGNSPHFRLKEWWYSHDASWCIVPNQHEKDIKAIPPQKVALLAQAILDKNTA